MNDRYVAQEIERKAEEKELKEHKKETPEEPDVRIRIAFPEERAERV